MVGINCLLYILHISEHFTYMFSTFRISEHFIASFPGFESLRMRRSISHYLNKVWSHAIRRVYCSGCPQPVGITAEGMCRQTYVCIKTYMYPWYTCRCIWKETSYHDDKASNELRTCVCVCADAAYHEHMSCGRSIQLLLHT